MTQDTLDKFIKSMKIMCPHMNPSGFCRILLMNCGDMEECSTYKNWKLKQIEKTIANTDLTHLFDDWEHRWKEGMRK